SPAFAGLFPTGGQIAHVLRTRAPCAIPYCYGTRTRLACVKHAASVRSEPGSNSRLKPVAWDKKSPPKFGEPADPSKLLSLDLLKPPTLEKGRWYERILAHRIDCQRAISPPVQQKGDPTT